MSLPANETTYTAGEGSSSSTAGHDFPKTDRESPSSSYDAVGGAQRDLGAPVASDEKNRDQSVGDKERGKGLTEGDDEMPDIPENNLRIVMPALGLVLFLAAIDQTIVATALPTISEDLNSSASEYSWVGTAYMLGSTLQTPINGRVSDIVGRKPMLYAAIVTFFVFSALCGAAKTSSWLIICRAFQGLGGGSIIGLTSIICSDIVPLEKRGAYQGFLGSAWGIAAVLGPIFGGLLTEKATWRWCFYINLPTCGIALAALAFTLKLNPTRKLTFKEFRSTFDFLGLFLLMIGSALLIVGFSRAADNGFDKPSSYGIIIGGAVMMAVAILNCMFTQRKAIIPRRMFKNRTTLFFLIASTVHAIAFLPANYLLPQLLQGLKGDSPLESGVHLLPFACCVAWMTVVAGQINSRLRIIRPVAWFGYGLAAIGYGLFYKFYTSDMGYATQEGLLVVTALGIGLSLQSPMLILQAAMPLKDMAVTTSAWALTRSMGGSIGLAIFTAVLNSSMRTRFEKISGYGTEFTVPESVSGYTALRGLPDGTMKEQVMEAFAASFGVCWIIASGLFASCLLMTLWTRAYSTRRNRGPQGVIPPEVSAPQSSSEIDLEALEPQEETFIKTSDASSATLGDLYNSEKTEERTDGSKR